MNCHHLRFSQLSVHARVFDSCQKFGVCVHAKRVLTHSFVRTHTRSTLFFLFTLLTFLWRSTVPMLLFLVFGIAPVSFVFFCFAYPKLTVPFMLQLVACVCFVLVEWLLLFVSARERFSLSEFVCLCEVATVVRKSVLAEIICACFFFENNLFKQN